MIQDGHHDAIMPVKQEGKDVSEVVCSTLAGSWGNCGSAIAGMIDLLTNKVIATGRIHEHEVAIRVSNSSL